MNETLTPTDAARIFADAKQWDKQLQHRTEGISWMVWGLAVGSYATGLPFLAQLNIPFPFMFFSWVPWIGGAALINYALWRSASLTQHDIPRPSAWSYAWKTLIVLVLLLLLHFVVKPMTMAIPVATIGIAWIAMASIVRWYSPEGRRLGYIIGSIVVLGGLLIGFLPMLTGMMVGTAIVGLVPLLAGLYHTLQA
jgi:hypothetical protein